VNGQNEITTKISVVIAGIFERYTYNVTQQDAPHNDKKQVLSLLWLLGMRLRTKPYKLELQMICFCLVAP
jgi:hypothetical protein